MNPLRHWNNKTVCLTPIDDLHVWGANPRDHDAEDVHALALSIEQFGWTEPILVQAGTNRVVAGHGRLLAARQLEMTEVPVAFLEMDDMEADAYAVADNQLATLSRWNPPKLKAVLQELDSKGGDYLAAIGFRPDEMDALLDRCADFLREYDAEKPEPEPGRVVGEARDAMVSLSVPLTEVQHALILKAIRLKKQQTGLALAGEALAAMCQTYIEGIPT